MKNLYFLIIALLTAISSYGQVQITEIHYDDTGADSNEGVEIAASVTTNLTGWSIVLYDNGGAPYSTTILTGNLASGSYLWTAISSIADGAGGIVLYNGTSVVSAFSYGTVTSPAGVTYTSLPVTEDKFTPGGTSMQLTDTGWVTEITATPGAAPSAGLTLSVVKNQIENFAMYPNPVSNGMLYMSSSNNVNKQVAIYAINGQQVYSKSLQLEETMNISNLNRGIYFVRIEEEGKISTRKLVVN